MIRRIAIIATLALGGCASYQSAYDQGYRDGNYRGNYDGGYYAAAVDGSGDYYYDRPELVVNGYGGGYFYGSCADVGFGVAGPFGYGFGCGPGFGYDPWFFGAWYPYHHWHRPWPGHPHPPMMQARHFEDGPHGGNRSHGSYVRPHYGP
jgi:hypothetical protein